MKHGSNAIPNVSPRMSSMKKMTIATNIPIYFLSLRIAGLATISCF